MTRLGVFGGTFNPPHYGHLILAEQARDQLSLDCVLWAPAADPPHKQGQPITPVEQRLAMVSLAIADNTSFELSTVDVERAGPHYSADMLALLNDAHPGADLLFLIGGDSLRDITTWHEPARILREARLAVMMRPGVEVDLGYLETQLPGIGERVAWVQAPLIDISGADIRARVAAGKSIRYLLPPCVQAYIDQHALYQG